MNGSRSSKRALEASRRERAARKAARKETRAETAPTTGPAGGRSEQEVIAALDALHRARDAGDIGLEEFETTRAELLSALSQ